MSGFASELTNESNSDKIAGAIGSRFSDMISGSVEASSSTTKLPFRLRTDKMKTFALAILILCLGTVAMRSFTHAEPPQVINCPGNVCPTNTVNVVRHWTYPGDITTHLQTSHGKQTAGMSIDQQLYAHDAIHESERGGLTRSVTRMNVQSVQCMPRAMSNCPGGVCPTSASSVTRSSSFSMPRLFRRR